MVSMQNNLQILENLYNINAINLSPAQESINKFLKEYQNGLY